MKLACTLFRLQPEAALDAFIGQTTTLGFPLLSRFSWRQDRVANHADSTSVLCWAAVDPAVRAPCVAAEIDMLGRNDDGTITWSPVATGLLQMAPDKTAVLNAFCKGYQPRIWRGSLVGLLRRYYDFTVTLQQDQNSEIAAWAKRVSAELEERIARQVEFENLRFAKIDESFE